MSTLAINTISGQTAANSVVVTGEGGTTTTSLQQGLAKSWVNFNGQGTIASRDSYNIASLTDSATGETGINYTSNMGNSNYNATTIPRINDSIKGSVASFHATSKIDVQSRANSVTGTETDSDYNCYTIHGDLA